MARVPGKKAPRRAVTLYAAEADKTNKQDARLTQMGQIIEQRQKLTQGDKDKLLTQQLVFLAIGKYATLTQQDKDRLSADDLFLLAIGKCVTLTDSDKSKMSVQQLGLLALMHK